MKNLKGDPSTPLCPKKYDREITGNRRQKDETADRFVLEDEALLDQLDQVLNTGSQYQNRTPNLKMTSVIVWSPFGNFKWSGGRSMQTLSNISNVHGCDAFYWIETP